MFERKVKLLEGDVIIHVLGSATYGNTVAVAEQEGLPFLLWQEGSRGYGSPYTQHLLDALVRVEDCRIVDGSFADFVCEVASLFEAGREGDFRLEVEVEIAQLKVKQARIRVWNSRLRPAGVEPRYDLGSLIPWLEEVKSYLPSRKLEVVRSA